MYNQIVGVPLVRNFTLTNSTTAYAAGDRMGTSVITLFYDQTSDRWRIIGIQA